jgi:hypothetical protein
MPPTMPNSDPSSNVKLSSVVEGSAIFVEDVVDDDLAEETDED